MQTKQILALCTLTLALAANAQTAPAHSMPMAPAAVDAPPGSAAATDLAEGEIRKIDKEMNKITIKHGVIKSMDMPGMTMVFQVKNPDLLGQVKVGDKVRFAAEKADGALVVTHLEPAP